MANRPPKPCTRCGKPAKLGQSLCPKHLAQMRERGDAKRGSPTSRGYGTRHRHGFREGVFAMWGRNCVHTEYDGSDLPAGTVFDPQMCGREATHADHYPTDRKTLVTRGLDPDDPRYGRPLCEYHHNQHTGRTQGRLAKGYTQK